MCFDDASLISNVLVLQNVMILHSQIFYPIIVHAEFGKFKNPISTHTLFNIILVADQLDPCVFLLGGGE